MKKPSQRNQLYIANALHLAWIDTKVRYKKSYLGPFWYTISNFIGVIALSLVWAQLMNEPLSEFVPKVALGLVLWQVIAGVLTEAPRLLNENAALVKNVNLPIWFLPARMMFRQAINFVHNLVLVGLILFYFKINPFLHFFALVVGLVSLFGILSLLSYMLAGFGARYRDVKYGVETLMPLLFFISPVVFKSNSINSALIKLNPITPLIEIVRLPVLGQSPDASIYWTALTIYMVLVPLAWIYGRYAEKNIAFWVT
jgi:lipopolysaccharide transport system permease protein